MPCFEVAGGGRAFEAGSECFTLGFLAVLIVDREFTCKETNDRGADFSCFDVEMEPGRAVFWCTLSRVSGLSNNAVVLELG